MSIGKCHKCFETNPVQFVLAQFHPKKAMSQPPFFDIEYWRSHRSFMSSKSKWNKIQSSFIVHHINYSNFLISNIIIFLFIPGTFHFLTEPGIFCCVSWLIRTGYWIDCLFLIIFSLFEIGLSAKCNCIDLWWWCSCSNSRELDLCDAYYSYISNRIVENGNSSCIILLL